MMFGKGRPDHHRSILFALGLAAAIGAGWGIFAGKDLNWDLLNYHYYVAYALLSGRLEQDFLAASVQSYFNPFAYVPLYLGISSGMHSVLVSMALAGVHGLSIAFLYFIARRLFADREPRQRLLFSMLAAALGCTTPVYWATVGTSFLEPLLVVPMLGGILLLLGKNGGEVSASSAWWAGILFGAAAGLKYSNAFFAIAALPVFFMSRETRWATRVRSLALYGAGGFVAVGLLAGPWMLLLYREFGNPLFPLMNAWFGSPYFSSANLAPERFALHGITEALELPFRMALADPWVYVEFRAPDVRFAALAVAAAGWIGLVLFRRRTERPQVVALRTEDRSFLVFFVAAFVLWLATSANGRYGLLVMLLAVVCLVRLVDLLLPRHAARVVLLLILALQISAGIIGSEARGWNSGPWTRDWFPLAVPDRAKTTPALYFTIETLSLSFLVPFMNPASSFVNLRGQYSVPPEGPGWQRIASLLARHPEHVRTLGRATQTDSKGTPSPELVQAYDGTLWRYGFRMDPTDCFLIRWRRDDEDALSRAANLLAGKIGSPPARLAFSCALRRAPVDAAEVRAERRISAVFDRLERACPGLFHGQTSITERLGEDWSRNYAGLEQRIETKGDRIFLAPVHSLEFIYLGTLEDWTRPDLPQLPICNR